MQNRWIQPVLAVIAVALLIVLAVLLLTGGGDDDVSLSPGQPQTVSVAQLESFAADADHAIYWVGEQDGTELELTEEEGGKVFIRYLPEGEADQGGGEALTVASYQVDEDAAAALERSVDEGGGKTIAKSDSGAVVLIDPHSPENVHLAYPGEEVQIEVFSPKPGEALRLSKDSVQKVP